MYPSSHKVLTLSVPVLTGNEFTHVVIGSVEYMMYPWYVPSAGRYLSEKHGVTFPKVRGWQIGDGGFTLKDFLDANRNFSVFVVPGFDSGAKDQSWGEVYSLEFTPGRMTQQLVLNEIPSSVPGVSHFHDPTTRFTSQKSPTMLSGLGDFRFLFFFSYASLSDLTTMSIRLRTTSQPL